MSNLEQIAQAKNVEQTTNFTSDSQPHNFGSTAYGAEALSDWRKAFGTVKQEDFKPTGSAKLDQAYGIQDNGPYVDPIEKLIREWDKKRPSITITSDGTGTITFPTKEEQDGLPEFGKRPADEKKDGLDYIREKAKEFFGVGQTMHEKVKDLVVAGLTPEQRAAYLREEKEWNQLFGDRSGPYIPEFDRLRNNPQGPMHDLVNKLTLATEKKIAEMAKQDLSPADRLKLERGLINDVSNDQTKAYEQKLLKIVAGFESKGELPRNFATSDTTVDGAKPNSRGKGDGQQSGNTQGQRRISRSANLPSW